MLHYSSFREKIKFLSSFLTDMSTESSMVGLCYLHRHLYLWQFYDMSCLSYSRIRIFLWHHLQCTVLYFSKCNYMSPSEHHRLVFVMHIPLYNNVTSLIVPDMPNHYNDAPKWTTRIHCGKICSAKWTGIMIRLLKKKHNTSPTGLRSG